MSDLYDISLDRLLKEEETYVRIIWIILRKARIR